MPLNEFCRTELLVGEEGIAKLHNSKVIVFGELVETMIMTKLLPTKRNIQC